jgi:pSer/pThr/pTyr-binding forkhead associated (FHA) protein
MFSRLAIVCDGVDKYFDPADSPITIGSKASCTIVLRGPLISRTHLRVTWNRRGYWVVADLDSTAGTFLESGRRVSGKVAIRSLTILILANARVILKPSA